MAAEKIATELRAARAQAGLTQVELAELARHYGLDWGRNTVASVELCRRHVSLDELPAIPMVLKQLTGRDWSLGELLPPVVIHDDPPRPTGADTPEGHAASVLGVELAELQQAALDLWGHDLTTERELRIDHDNLTGSLRATRGHVTRTLINELEDHDG